MASISSDGCTAPENFLLPSELDDVGERIGCTLLKCPLCQYGRRNFYCEQCVQNGEFVHSISVFSERFVEKQARLSRLQTARSQLEEKCTKAFERYRQRDKLLCDISSCKERIRLLREIQSETKQNIVNGKETIRSLRKDNLDIVLRLPKQEEQIAKLDKKVNSARIIRDNQKESIEKKKVQMKRVIRMASKLLIKYIFPISIAKPSKSNEDDEGSVDGITSALADASGTSYVRGKWINDAENSLEIHHKIVEATLPASGDYSAYTLWMAENKDGVPGGSKHNVMNNPAWNTLAALTNASQLANVLACYVDLRLPYKLSLNEFYESEMSDQKFARKVAKLNSNILHLCFSQKTNVSVLQPMHTIKNLLNLLNTEHTDLGRVGPIEADSVVMANLHSELVFDLENSDDSVTDDEDNFNHEWEAVPYVACPEMTIPIPGAMTIQSSSMQINQSVAGGLVTSAAASIASIWRGWTTK